MSVDSPNTPDTEVGTLPDPTLQDRRGPKPVAHGAAVQCVFNDTDRDDTVYKQVFDLWQSVVGDHANEPGIVARFGPDRVDWLGDPKHGDEWAIKLTSSRWKGGTGEGDNFSKWYKYDLTLREIDDDDTRYRPDNSCSLRVIPQLDELHYEDGNEITYQYGTGSLVRCNTTWAKSSEEVESRMMDVLEIVLDVDRGRLLEDQNHDSRRIQKAESHHRFDIGWKRQVIETIDQTRQLIAYGGMSEIDAHQERERAGYLEAVLDADRWHLLGFERTTYDIELKCYQTEGWSEIPRTDPSHHPKIEASFSGTKGDHALPHVDEWDDVMQTLSTVVSSHLDWSGVGREQLVADDFQDGPGRPEYVYPHPTGRREQLKERYDNVSTEIYREALKANTEAVYDILSVVATNYGASYDFLEKRTGLARSTIRHHAKRLQEAGVIQRIGNPVLVVFPSPAVLDDAKEILRKVYPDDMVDDMDDRAEERRQRREERDDPDTNPDDQEENNDADDDRDRSEWEYFAELFEIGPDQLATALDRGHIEEDHVRIRTDPYNWLG